jgi:hypothetical protein
MASILHKNYLIVVSIEYDPRRFVWKPSAIICWRADRRQHYHKLNGLLKCGSSSEAEAMAMEAAKSWVDAREPISAEIGAPPARNSPSPGKTL